VNSRSSYKLFVIRVGSNEEPQQYIAPGPSDSAIVIGDSDRPQIFVAREFLKFQVGVARVLAEQSISVTNLLSDWSWKLSQVAAEIGSNPRSHSRSGSSS
jgi:hypothetical protein